MEKKLCNLAPEPEIYGKERADELSSAVEGLSEMHATERAFVTGLLLHYKPQKVLEIGVSAGGGTVVILNAIRDIEGAHLHSIDLFERYYRDKSKFSGWMVDEFTPELKSIWTAHLGKDAVEVIDEIGAGIEFLVLDTAHIHPVETLNFLCVLPYLNDGAIVVLHDISLHLQRLGYATASYAGRLLFQTVTAEKLLPVEKYAPCANIGAFQVNSDTRKYAFDLFSSLYLPWGRLYSKPWRELVPQRLIEPHACMFEKTFGAEYRDMFLGAVQAQDALYDEISLIAYIKILIGSFMRSVVKRLKRKRKA